MNPETARFRAAVITEIRRYFTELGYIEVDTPLLSPHLIPETSIEVFSTTLLREGRPDTGLYLTPSPEVWMKPLIAGGYGSIFQICRCFRNGEQQGRQHNPEFTMLEWYSVDRGSADNITVTEGLFERMIPFGLPETLRPPFRRMSMDEACQEFAAFDPSACPDMESIIATARRLGIRTDEKDTWEGVFNRLFVELVEPNLPEDRPLVLYDYPAAIPCLARLKDDGFHRDRWELYTGGFECANCFFEETDSIQVSAYFRDEGKKKMNTRVPHTVDPRWPDMYRRPHPPVSGVALGVDRLLAAVLGKHSLDGVIFFPLCDILEK